MNMTFSLTACLMMLLPCAQEADRRSAIYLTSYGLRLTLTP